jgi:ABC-type polysaccharide/polyol phosphate transport system ATPase subunit
MSSELSIKVTSLSKRYQIYNNPRDRLQQFFVPRLQSMLRLPRKQYFRDFWALRNISFDVKKGETVGIIGRNGSGKSTLLQIICGTLSQSEGTVVTSGRIAALLELGSGFNPEFTGEENVRLNAAVLGLKTDEINAKFDDIVAFADIGEFIHQPVKTYSSGMFIRLAFAVIVHTEPEILVIDEALSVGDFAFQNKCMQKLAELKSTGVSILFVSHDLSTTQIICDRVVWLHESELKMDGDPIQVCQEYYAFVAGINSSDLAPLSKHIPQQSTGVASFTDLHLTDSKGMKRTVFETGEDICFKFRLTAQVDISETVFTISVYKKDGDWLLGQTSKEEGVFWKPIPKGAALDGDLVLIENCLTSGDYLVAFAAFSKDLTICYALTDLTLNFSVRTTYQTWGKFVHPCKWSNASHP